MLIRVKIKTGGNKEGIQKISHPDYDYKATVKAQPEKGKANEALIKLISKSFDASRQDIIIKKGLTSTIKHIYIPK